MAKTIKKKPSKVVSKRKVKQTSLSPSQKEQLLLQSIKKRSTSTLTYIAHISETILSDPQKHINLFKILFDLYTSEKQYHLILLTSLGVIFSHCLPGYRIRTNDKDENHLKKSRSTLHAQQYEQKLLQYYEQFLAQLNKQKGPTIPIICDVFLASPQFNHSDHLFTMMIKYILSFKNAQTDHALQTVEYYLESDPTLNASIRLLNCLEGISAKKLPDQFITQAFPLLHLLSRINFTLKESFIQDHDRLHHQHLSKDVQRDLTSASIHGSSVRKHEDQQARIIHFLVSCATKAFTHTHEPTVLCLCITILNSINEFLTSDITSAIVSILQNHLKSHHYTFGETLRILDGIVCYMKQQAPALTEGVREWIVNVIIQNITSHISFESLLATDTFVSPTTHQASISNTVNAELKTFRSILAFVRESSNFKKQLAQIPKSDCQLLEHILCNALHTPNIALRHACINSALQESSATLNCLNSLLEETMDGTSEEISLYWIEHLSKVDIASSTFIHNRATAC